MSNAFSKVSPVENTLVPSNKNPFLVFIQSISWAEISPEKWIPELKETVAEAEDALEKLTKLKIALQELEEELEEMRCMLK